MSNESNLTGESEDKQKSMEHDPFLLSSCLITQGNNIKGLVIGVGLSSQWGRIKSSLVAEPLLTPLQHKLNHLTTFVSKNRIISLQLAPHKITNL